MRRYALVVGVLIVTGGVGLSAIYVAWMPSYNRETFRKLEADVFHPTFFSRFALAREHGMAWVSNPSAVALDYVGRTRNCPTQQIGVLSPEQDSDGHDHHFEPQSSPAEPVVVGQAFRRSN